MKKLFKRGVNTYANDTTVENLFDTEHKSYHSASHPVRAWFGMMCTMVSHACQFEKT